MFDANDFAVLATRQPELTIEACVRLADRAGYFTPEMLEGALEAFKKAQTRKWLKAAKDEAGFPIFESLFQARPDGTTRYVYKQLELFTIPESTQVIGRWVKRATYAMRRAEAIRARVVKRYGPQPQLDFPWEVDDAPQR